MSDLSEITKAIEASNAALEQFKLSKNAEIDTLKTQLETAEAKQNRREFFEAPETVSLDGLKTLRTPAEIKSHYQARAKEHDEESVGLADFLRGVAGMKATPLATKALAEGTNSTGGYAVPNLLQSSILQALVPASSLMVAGCGIVPLNPGATTTFAAIDTIPTAAWRAEGGAVAESDPAFRAVVATPRSLAFLFKISRELLADGSDVDNALRTAIAQAFAKELDRAGLRGSGSAPEPKGLLNTTGIQAVTNGTNGTALAGYANLFSAVAAILAANAPMPTAAIMSPRSLVKLGGLVDTLGQPIRVPEMLLKTQLIATSQIPNNLTVGTSSDCSEIYVGDFTRMAFAMRENVSILVADQLYAATGQIAFIGHVRADVIVTYPTAFGVVTGVRA